MTTRPHLQRDAAEAGFDQALRDHHAVAVERISPRVRAQLAQRRHAALRGQPAAAPTSGLRHAVTGAAFAAVLALGFTLLPGTSDSPAPATDTALAGNVGAPAPNTLLDEDPEFYAWLASADVQQLAME